MLEIVQDLRKKYRIHYSTDTVFDRYLLDRQGCFKKSSQTKHLFIIFTIITSTGKVFR